MIALGVMIALTEPVTFDSMMKAIRQSFSETSAAKNLEAVRYGQELAKETPGRKVQTV
jgi:Pyruvate/2-oxoacid:ferredoxin oxidoreductase gamma subunit